VTDPPVPVRGPSWAAVPPADALTAAGLAVRLGHYCWAEQQLFSLLGGWVVGTDAHDAKALLLELAEHAAWRAQRWYELLPTAPPGADALVAAPEGAVPLAELVDGALDGPGGERRDAGPATRFACAARVLLPRLLAAYTAHLDWSDHVRDAAVRRVLAVALDDLSNDLRHAERLTQAMLEGGLDVSSVTAATAAVEQALVARGGLLGPSSVGRRPV
jgi:hypothetical protein